MSRSDQGVETADLPPPHTSETSMSSNLFLVLRNNGQPAFANRLSLGDLTIGRSPENDISLALDTISRKHARLSVGEQGVIVTDLNSRNGTFVNRKRIHCAAVFPGELIQLGSVLLLLSHDPSGLEGQDPEEVTRDARSLSGINANTPLPLTPAQTVVFNLLIQGYLHKEIADELDRSVDTINNHVKKIFEAYGVHSKVELLLKVMPR